MIAFATLSELSEALERLVYASILSRPEARMLLKRYGWISNSAEREAEEETEYADAS